jgi:hypothetical protein
MSAALGTFGFAGAAAGDAFGVGEVPNGENCCGAPAVWYVDSAAAGAFGFAGSASGGAFGFGDSAAGGAAGPAFAFLSGASSGGSFTNSSTLFGGGGDGFVNTSAFGIGAFAVLAGGGRKLSLEVDDDLERFL